MTSREVQNNALRRESLVNIDQPGPMVTNDPKDPLKKALESVERTRKQTVELGKDLTTDRTQAWDPARVAHVRFPFSS